MTTNECIAWLNYLKDEEHQKADSYVPCVTEVALQKAIEILEKFDGLTSALETGNRVNEYLSAEKNRIIKAVNDMCIMNSPGVHEYGTYQNGLYEGLRMAYDIIIGKEETLGGGEG